MYHIYGVRTSPIYCISKVNTVTHHVTLRQSVEKNQGIELGKEQGGRGGVTRTNETRKWNEVSREWVEGNRDPHYI
jgi:hypothetical protein